MNRATWLTWVLLCVWAAWLNALQGVLAQGVLGVWTPDLGLVLFLAIAPRIAAADLPKVALVAALSRSAFSIDPPVAIAAAYLAASLFADATRAVIDLRTAVFRTLVGALSGGAIAVWLATVHEVRVGRALQFAAESAAWSPGVAACAGVSTGVAALLLAPVFARLPGLTPLLRRREWHSVASYP